MSIMHLCVTFLLDREKTVQERSGEGQVMVLLQTIFLFVLLKQLAQMLQVNFVKSVNILAFWTRTGCDLDWLPHCKQIHSWVVRRDRRRPGGGEWGGGGVGVDMYWWIVPTVSMAFLCGISPKLYWKTPLPLIRGSAIPIMLCIRSCHRTTDFMSLQVF